MFLLSIFMFVIFYFLFFFNDTATTEIYTLSLHDALPIYPALKHVGRSFAADLGRVAGQPAAQLSGVTGAPREVVLVGELGRSPLVDGLVAAGKLKAADLKGLKGEWEAYRQVVVDKPFKGVDRALVIVGSDRRG